MKIEKVNDSRLLWSLNKEDFMEYKLNVNDFLYGTKKARTLFQEAMKKAEKDLMFQVEGYLLHCQLQELSSSGITFSITRKEQLPKTEENQSDAESVNHTMGTQEDLHLLYEFADLDDVIRVSRLINTEIPLENALYKFEDEYLLFVEPNKDEGEQMAWCTINLAEFADVESVTRGQKALLCEHSECILEKDALQKLRVLS